MPKSYPPESCRKVLDLVSPGRRVAEVAADLDSSEQRIYLCCRQHLIDTGRLPDVTSTDHAELVAARRRIGELGAEVEIHRRAAKLLKEVVVPRCYEAITVMDSLCLPVQLAYRVLGVTVSSYY